MAEAVALMEMAFGGTSPFRQGAETEFCPPNWSFAMAAAPWSLSGVVNTVFLGRKGLYRRAAREGRQGGLTLGRAARVPRGPMVWGPLALLRLLVLEPSGKNRRFHVGAGIPGVAPHYIPPPSTFNVLLDSYWFHVGAGITGVAPHYIPPPSTFNVLLDSYWFDKPWFLTEGNLLLYASHLPLGVPNERVLYASSGISLIGHHKDYLDACLEGSFTSKEVEARWDLLDRIEENAEDWENDKGKESGYVEKPPFKPLPPKEGNEEKEEEEEEEE
ncbi:hypothetical protein QYE76_001810 [Lolium multiflorum]|uniref:Uncharacterized protein n=1 Tax=Lolium multiflorum TaxID=4521 RepID=A0AAD8VXA6_LOLMU|nr:hypothetical protein QYE76_001810 [Lolium multiflorum]